MNDVLFHNIFSHQISNQDINIELAVGLVLEEARIITGGNK